MFVSYASLNNEVNTLSDWMSHFSSKSVKEWCLLKNKSRIKYCVNVILNVKSNTSGNKLVRLKVNL